MFRRSDNRLTRALKIAKREAANRAQFVRVSPTFINHYSGKIGGVPIAASGLNKFGSTSSNVSRTGVTQVPIGYNPSTFGVFDDNTESNTSIGVTALIFGTDNVPLGYGLVVSRSMFKGNGGILFRDDRENNAIQVSCNPVFSPNYWMGI